MCFTFAYFWLYLTEEAAVPGATEVVAPVDRYFIPTVGFDVNGLPILPASCWFCSKIWFISSYFFEREAPEVSLPVLWLSS